MQQQHDSITPIRFLKVEEVGAMTGLHRATIYKLIADKSRRFPPPLRVSKSARRWRESDVIDWMNSRTVGVGKAQPEAAGSQQ